ncbi:MAG TPA: efflux RND transporter periplasmic adaptor subunit, partial [Patescibacteria group bacterium]|nr:efflux RND transporter periplasmic adaptor subunit [Patescibacteria group bacterium]
ATQTVEPHDITQTVSASGTVDSLSSVNLNFLAGGKLAYLGVKEGDTVNKGEVIATLDQRTAKVNLENALIDYSKERNTFDQTIEDNNGHTPSNALTDAMKRILEDNQYDLDKAVNSVELDSLAQEQSTLTTPIAGIVTRADVETAGVNVGATTTFTVADPNSLVFKEDVDESDIGQVHVGQAMSISLDAYPDKTIRTTVKSIDFASHTTSTGGTAYTVEGDLPVSGQLYRIGMNGDGDIIVASALHTLTIPLSSLIDETHVYVKTGQTFLRKTVKLGIQSDTDAQVLSGLSPGDKVALTPDDVEAAFPKLKNQ